MTRLTSSAIVMSILLLASNIAGAAPRIAILNFELNDITSRPNTPKERIRTASFRPLLEQELLQLGNYEIISISHTEQAAANPSFGYLFSFDDLASDLGKRHGADWVVVGQHSKPSFLFSYLMAHLIQVKKRKLAADFAIELKGNHQEVNRRGAKALAKEIHALINQLKH